MGCNIFPHFWGKYFPSESPYLISNHHPSALHGTLQNFISLRISVSSVCFKQRTAAPATRGSTSATRSNKWGKALLANLANCSWGVKRLPSWLGVGDATWEVGRVGGLVKCHSKFYLQVGGWWSWDALDWLLSLGAWKGVKSDMRNSDRPEKKWPPTFLWIEWLTLLRWHFLIFVIDRLITQISLQENQSKKPLKTGEASQFQLFLFRRSQSNGSFTAGDFFLSGPYHCVITSQRSVKKTWHKDRKSNIRIGRLCWKHACAMDPKKSKCFKESDMKGN